MLTERIEFIRMTNVIVLVAFFLLTQTTIDAGERDFVEIFKLIQNQLLNRTVPGKNFQRIQSKQIGFSFQFVYLDFRLMKVPVTFFHQSKPIGFLHRTVVH